MRLRRHRAGWGRARRRSWPVSRGQVAALVVGVAVPAALVYAGFHERHLAGRGVPPPVLSPTPSLHVTTPILSLRRIPGAVAEPLVTKPLRDKLNAAEKKLPAASCMVVDADGSVITEHNAEAALIPASNMKLLTGAVALEVLGPDYHFVTKMFGALTPNGKNVYDLFIVGGGDPLLSTPKYREASKTYQSFADTPWTEVDSLVDQLKARGITGIVGDIYGDDSRYYGTGPYAPRGDTRVDNWPDATIGPTGPLVISDGRTDYTRITFAAEPAKHAAEQMKKLITDAGIKVNGEARPGTMDEAVPELGRVESAPLKSIVAEMLTRSDNETAEQLLREIALVKGRPATRVDGAAVVRDVLTSWGVPVDGLNQVDGSGLSRDNTATCRTLVGVLKHEGVGSDFAGGLAVPGRPGTLKDSLTSSAVKDRLSAKTGSLTGVRALSGFVTAIGGRHITFSLITNDLPKGLERPPFDAVLTAMTDAFGAYPARIDLAAFGPTQPGTP